MNFCLRLITALAQVAFAFVANGVCLWKRHQNLNHKTPGRRKSLIQKFIDSAAPMRHLQRINWSYPRHDASRGDYGRLPDILKSSLLCEQIAIQIYLFVSWMDIKTQWKYPNRDNLAGEMFACQFVAIWVAERRNQKCHRKTSRDLIFVESIGFSVFPSEQISFLRYKLSAGPGIFSLSWLIISI